jgi:hypothetical protein
MMNHLGSVYFHQVWNATNDHGRANFPLAKAAERLQTGSIPVGHSVVGLPTTDKVYAVYRVAVHAFGRFTSLPSHEWVKDSSVLAEDHVQISTYASSGRKIPEGGVWLRFDPLRGTVLVAIDRNLTSGCIGESYPKLYMTVYYDTTRLTPTVTQLMTVGTGAQSPANVAAAIAAAKAQYPAGTILFINGWTYTPDRYPTLTPGNIVQITCDPDIAGYCELAIDDNVTGYYSERYKEYREVLHIPKALNPNNVTITNDTLTLVVFDPATGRGVYGHQIDDHAVESITHNDFSVGRNNLQVFQNSLGSTGVSARLYVRFPTDPQRLQDETNHIKDLYTLSDAEIKRQLVGMSANQITEWKASFLEKSAFLDLLYHFDHLGDTNLAKRYTDAMGYYNVASTLAETMHYYTYKGGEVTISKPARLIDFPCQVIVYADGRKVPHHFVGLTDCGGGVKLGFKAGSFIAHGTRIGVYITEDGSNAAIPYNPTLSVPTITVPHDDYRLVKVVPYDTPKTIVGGSTTKGYRTIPVSPADYRVTQNSNGTSTFKVSTSHYNNAFYLVPICGLTTQVVELDAMIQAKQPIVLPLEMKDINNQVIPLVGSEIIEIYTNGYRLIEDIDYSCTPVLGDNGDVLQQILQVSNQEYLDLAGSGNVLEVLVHGDKPVSIDKGYAIQNKLHRDLPPMAWSASCGRAFVRGKLVEKVTENGTTLISQTNLKDGSPYLLEWTVPYGVGKILSTISPVSEENLRTRITRVLRLTKPVYPALVTITDQYTLYSPYLARIVRDVADGTLVLIDEAKDDAFLKQLDGYKLLLERDVILGRANPLLDRRFVTLAAHYANLTGANATQMVLVQRLISLTLLPAQLAISEVLV